MKIVSLLSVIVSGVLFTACGTIEVPEGYDKSMYPYLERFQEAAASVRKNVTLPPMKLEVIDGDLLPGQPFYVGYCDVSQSMPVIRVKKSYWKKQDDTGREVLMFHELGHCVLRRGHFEIYNPVSGIPVSLMNSQLVKSEHYRASRAFYLTELFWGVSPTRVTGDEGPYVCVAP